jgi:hypothetical protein
MQLCAGICNRTQFVNNQDRTVQGDDWETETGSFEQIAM